MKKKLLATLTACMAGLALSAQVTVFVQQPPGLEGPLDFTWSQWGAQPDLNDIANNIVGTACFVDDGTAADSLGCTSPLVNAAQLAGKIAVVYRGTCEFGAKALNAEQAGAIAVVIINNAAGAPVGMGAGAVGATVTIPTIMISQGAGAQLRDAIATCNDLELFIGSQTNFFQNNLGFYKQDILVPRISETNSLIASDASEFSVLLGGMMHNYGSVDMPNARLQCVVTQDGSPVYDQTSTGVTLLSGDSLFVALPDFTQPGYTGHYEITYSLLGDNTDEFSDNNTTSTTLTIGDKLTYVPADAGTQLPISDQHILPATNTLGFRSCIHFSDPNASRLAITGIWFNCSRAATDVLTDELMTGALYQWTEPITDQITLPTDAGLIPLTSAEYAFPSDLDMTDIYMPFTDQVQLVDGQNYVVCLESYSGIVRHGWNNSLDHTRVQEYTLTPISCIKNKEDDTWYNGFTGIAGPPSIGIQVIDANTIGIEEETDNLQVSPYPNPVRDQLSIPVRGYAGAATMRVFNASGAQVMDQRTSVANNGTLVVDMCGMANGLYTFQMDFDGGKHAEFRVLVNR
jgi:PA domain